MTKNSHLRGKGFVWKRAHKKVGRNDPCPCGSGEKYKDCQCDKSEYEQYAVFKVKRKKPNSEDLPTLKRD